MEARRPFVWRIWDWLDGRYQLAHLLEASVDVKVPRTVRTFYLGGLTLFFFLVQVVTGILLAIYYQPTPDAAYNSVLYIMNQVNFGWLIRSIHAWSANLMVIMCLLHLLRVFFQGAYKKPREMTWVVGTLLLVLTLGFGFTGYLLPWDQRAFWATTIGSEVAGAVPLIGDKLLIFLRGGPEITAHTLSRFFGVHVLVLPVTLGAILGLHLLQLHLQGVADPTRPVAKEDEIAALAASESGSTQERRKWLPFFPNYVLDEIIVWYMMLAVIVILASLFPAGLEEPADPLRTPEHIKPEWYFLFVYQFFKLVPRIVGVAVPFVGGLLLLLLPFLDRNPHVSPRKRPVGVSVAIVVIVGIIILSIWGWLS